MTSVTRGNGAAATLVRGARPRGADGQVRRWILLIYTVPAEPSRKRAYVWRELKKLGAVYLRDGVAVLPQTSATGAAFGTIAKRIHEFDGQATLVSDVRLEPERAATVEAAAHADRAAEYAELMAEAERFLEHARRERAHRVFTYPEVESLDADLRKLRQWADQIGARDYFGHAAGKDVTEMLNRCRAVLDEFVDEVSRAADQGDEAPM